MKNIAETSTGCVREIFPEILLKTPALCHNCGVSHLRCERKQHHKARLLRALTRLQVAKHQRGNLLDKRTVSLKDRIYAGISLGIGRLRRRLEKIH